MWVRGVPIRMKEYVTSKNSDNTNNYIIEYPDYVLKDIYENYKCVDYIEFKGNISSAQIYRADRYETKINDDNFINIKSFTYDNALAPLNLLQSQKKTDLNRLQL